MNGDMLRNRWLLAGTIALALSSVNVPASAGQRPLSDFTSHLGAWCAVFNDQGFDCANSYYGGPTCAYGGFTFPAVFSWFDPNMEIVVLIDSFDWTDQNVLGGSLPTTLNGSVTESKAPGGLADVKVVLHTSRALTRAFDGETGAPLFGYFAGEVLAGAPPTLGESFLQINSALDVAESRTRSTRCSRWIRTSCWYNRAHLS